MTQDEENLFLKTIADRVAQTEVVVYCIVRALVRQPGYDSARFLQALKEEEMNLPEGGREAKSLIKNIISGVEGYQ
jgi:hypothetical protein